MTHDHKTRLAAAALRNAQRIHVAAQVEMQRARGIGNAAAIAEAEAAMDWIVPEVSERAARLERLTTPEVNGLPRGPKETLT